MTVQREEKDDPEPIWPVVINSGKTWIHLTGKLHWLRKMSTGVKHHGTKSDKDEEFSEAMTKVRKDLKARISETRSTSKRKSIKQEVGLSDSEEDTASTNKTRHQKRIRDKKEADSQELKPVQFTWNGTVTVP